MPSTSWQGASGDVPRTLLLEGVRTQAEGAGGLKDGATPIYC